jgi:hypothetical protein
MPLKSLPKPPTALDKAGLTPEDVDWIVPHQANIRIIEGTAKRMQVPMDRVVVTVQDHGNTSAASIPLALSVGKARADQARRSDRDRGDRRRPGLGIGRPALVSGFNLAPKWLILTRKSIRRMVMKMAGNWPMGGRDEREDTDPDGSQRSRLS